MKNALIIMSIFMIFFLLTRCQNAPAKKEEVKSKTAQNVERFAFVKPISGLVLRSQPSVDSDKLAVITYRTKVQILDENDSLETINNITARWTKVKIADYRSKQGWVFGGYLTEVMPEQLDYTMKEIETLDLMTYFKTTKRNFCIYTNCGTITTGGASLVNDNPFGIDWMVGCHGGEILKFIPSKNSVTLHVKQVIVYDCLTASSLKSVDYFKCVINKDDVINSIKNNSDKERYIISISCLKMR